MKKWERSWSQSWCLGAALWVQGRVFTCPLNRMGSGLPPVTSQEALSTHPITHPEPLCLAWLLHGKIRNKSSKTESEQCNNAVEGLQESCPICDSCEWLRPALGSKLQVFHGKDNLFLDETAAHIPMPPRWKQLLNMGDVKIRFSTPNVV